MKLVVTRFFLVLLLAGVVPALQATVHAGGDITTTLNSLVQTCTGYASKCKQTLNAIGETAVFDVKGVSVTDWGTISQDTKTNVAFPKNPGDVAVYSLTPTAGESKDTKIYLLLKNVQQRKGFRLFGKSVVTAFRQFQGESKTQWVEVGSVASNRPIFSVEMTITTDGVIKVPNPKIQGAMILFEVGKKKF